MDILRRYAETVLKNLYPQLPPYVDEEKFRATMIPKIERIFLRHINLEAIYWKHGYDPVAKRWLDIRDEDYQPLLERELLNLQTKFVYDKPKRAISLQEFAAILIPLCTGKLDREELVRLYQEYDEESDEEYIDIPLSVWLAVRADMRRELTTTITECLSTHELFEPCISTLIAQYYAHDDKPGWEKRKK